MDYLAHLEVNEKATSELTAPPGPNQVVVAIVPAFQTNLIPAVLRLANQVRELVIVLLEGFAKDEIPLEFPSRLKGTNLKIIRCSRGNLELAIKELSNFFT